MIGKVIFVVAVIAIASIGLQQAMMISDCYAPGGNDELGKTHSLQSLFLTCERISYPSNATVTGPSLEYGFDASLEHLNFGIIPMGSAGRRYLDIGNENGGISKVMMSSFGNISELVSFNKNGFLLEEGEKTRVEAIFKPAEESVAGPYKGGITVTRIYPRNFVGGILMGMV